MAYLYLVRHGETTWNAERRWQGQYDLPLSAVGRRQADAVARRLAGEHPVALYSSDLARAWSTAEAIGRACSLAPVADQRLREVDVGSWQGLTEDDVRRLDPDGHERWRTGSTGWSDGEPYGVMGERAVAAVGDLLTRHGQRDERIVVVCHGGVIRALVMHALNVPVGERNRFATGPNATITLIHAHPDRWVLVSYNDSGHLDQRLPPHADAGEADAEP